MDTGITGGRILCYEDGEMIFEEDSTGNEIFIIESGKVEIAQRINGKSITISVLGKGDLFGETAVFTDAPRSSIAIAVGRTTLMSFTMEEILHRMQNNIQFAIAVMQALVNRLRNTSSTLKSSVAMVYEFCEEFANEIFPEKRPLKLGEILVEMGYLAKSQLERCLQKQKEAHMLEHRHKLLGEIMVELCFITDEQLREALAEQQIRLRNRFE